jgi:hypothetical protein
MTFDTSTALRTADPAAGIHPDPSAPEATRILAGVLATPRMTRRRSRAPRRAIVGSALAVCAALAVFVGVGSNPASHLGQAAYSVTRSTDGTVHVVVRWSALRDPAALQRALDRAGARVRIFVVRDGTTLCAHGTSGAYPQGAVEWHAPIDANTENGIVVHPDEFPAGATFVLVVELAPSGSTGLSTLSAGFPQITGTLSYMARGPVTPPSC